MSLNVFTHRVMSIRSYYEILDDVQLYMQYNLTLVHAEERSVDIYLD